MAININTGFHVGSAAPIDDRAYLSKAQMLAINESIYPDYFLAVCSDDGGLYVYNKSAVASAETGKFVALHTDATRPIQVTELPEASDTEAGNVYQFVGSTDDNFTCGFWYMCKQNAETSAYEWIQLNTQPDAKVTLEAAETPTEGYLKTYVISQFGDEVGKIDIPKDLVVTSGTVEKITFDADSSTYSDGVGTYTADDVANAESDFYGYPTNAGTFLKLTIANQEIPVFIDAKDIVGDDLGDLAKELTSNVEIGGINIGDVLPQGMTFSEFAEKLVVKYFPPDVKLTSTPENKVVEIGETVNVELTATVTRRSEDVTGVTFYKDGTVLEEVADVSATGGTFTHTVADGITATTTFKVSATDGGGTDEASVTYTFVKPYYTGEFEDGTEVALADMTKKIETEGTKTYTFTVDNKIIVFAQPSEYAALTSIVDGNGFENIESFTVDESSITGYRIYCTNTPVTCNNFKYTFM